MTSAFDYSASSTVPTELLPRTTISFCSSVLERSRTTLPETKTMTLVTSRKANSLKPAIFHTIAFNLSLEINEDKISLAI